MATSDGTEASEFDDASNAFCHIVAPASVVAEAYPRSASTASTEAGSKSGGGAECRSMPRDSLTS